MLHQLCNECGCSVKPGSGLFVNRVIDLNDKPTRFEQGKPFPEGDFICRECEEEIGNLFPVKSLDLAGL